MEDSAFGVFFDQNDPVFSLVSIKFAAIVKQVWALL